MTFLFKVVAVSSRHEFCNGSRPERVNLIGKRGYAMQTFIPGIQLSETFFREAVQPVVEAHWPDMAFSAARLDFGSDVLGFDTPQSRDHGWGPMLTLYLGEDDYDRYCDEIAQVLACELPLAVCGYSTHFDEQWRMAPANDRPVNHKVRVATVAGFFREYVGIDPMRPIAPHAWLAVPTQRLRTIASGRVFRDGLSTLEPARRALAWYPHDVWLYLMANQWRRIDQEEPFMARCGDVGDGLGSRMVAMRLVDNLMRLCFLIERRHAPYIKWFGTAFSRLSCARHLLPVFRAVTRSERWKQREEYLSTAYRIVMRMHNDLGVTPPIEPEVSPFHNRPYQVPHGERFVEALHAAIRSETVKGWPRYVGAVWQFCDSTDVLDSIERCKTLTGTYSTERDTT